MKEANPDPLSILSPEELQWFGQWLSGPLIAEAIQHELRQNSHCPHSQIFNVLEAMRARVENGLPPTGKLWQEPSAEETRKSISKLQQRLESYND
jgi:hypothetical protein